MKLTQERVDRSLNQALDNGYDLHFWPAENIAADLAEYDVDFEGVDPKTIEPFVADWKKRKEATA